MEPEPDNSTTWPVARPPGIATGEEAIDMPPAAAITTRAVPWAPTGKHPGLVVSGTGWHVWACPDTARSICRIIAGVLVGLGILLLVLALLSPATFAVVMQQIVNQIAQNAAAFFSRR